MSTVLDLKIPKFCKRQKVEFIGGLGTIIQDCLNSGYWSYLVEMEMGSEPEMGKLVMKLQFYYLKQILSYFQTSLLWLSF